MNINSQDIQRIEKKLFFDNIIFDENFNLGQIHNSKIAKLYHIYIFLTHNCSGNSDFST